MFRQKIIKLIESAIKDLQKEGKFLDFKVPEIIIEYPKEKNYGDYSTNIAMKIANVVKKSPIEIAENLSEKLKAKSEKFFEKIEVAEPGFINFFISKEYLQNQVKEILKNGDKFGSPAGSTDWRIKINKGKKINVEFISANPTGPLTLGNGRGGFCGDVLANILEKAGYKVIREYYINNRGEQVIKLGHSVLGDSESVYKGKYIEDLRKKIKGDNPEMVGEKAAGIIMKEMIKPAIKKMGIKFDVWFSEKSLYQKKEVDKILKILKEKKIIYEKEEALWFKSTNFGDDKDRVLIKADGEKTYFLSDIAYLKNKFKRGFDKLIFFLGADHYGYIARLKAAAEVLGYRGEQVNAIVMQLVRLFENGRETRMSKRSGIYVTINELIDEVGLDVARFFFLTRSPNTHLNFDLDLAKKKSKDNPVYYIQYAYARICSIIKKLKVKSEKLKTTTQKLKLLNHSTEIELIKQLVRLPEIIEDTTKDYQVQRLPQYALDLADNFHRFYENCRVISEDKNLTQARLSLVMATKIVLKNTLSLMGIKAPEKM